MEKLMKPKFHSLRSNSQVEETIRCKTNVIGTFERSASKVFNNLPLSYRKAETYLGYVSRPIQQAINGI